MNLDRRLYLCGKQISAMLFLCAAGAFVASGQTDSPCPDAGAGAIKGIQLHSADAAMAPPDAVVLLRTGTSLVVRKGMPVLRQNSMRTENSAIPCRDGCPIQVIPSPLSAKILSRRNARAAYLYMLRMEEPRRFRDATLIRIRQPGRSGGAGLPVAHEKGRDLRL